MLIRNNFHISQYCAVGDRQMKKKWNKKKQKHWHLVWLFDFLASFPNELFPINFARYELTSWMQNINCWTYIILFAKGKQNIYAHVYRLCVCRVTIVSSVCVCVCVRVTVLPVQFIGGVSHTYIRIAAVAIAQKRIYRQALAPPLVVYAATRKEKGKRRLATQPMRSIGAPTVQRQCTFWFSRLTFFRQVAFIFCVIQFIFLLSLHYGSIFELANAEIWLKHIVNRSVYIQTAS